MISYREIQIRIFLRFRRVHTDQFKDPDQHFYDWIRNTEVASVFFSPAFEIQAQPVNWQSNLSGCLFIGLLCLKNLVGGFNNP